jgi:hypothetical protein
MGVDRGTSGFGTPLRRRSEQTVSRAVELCARHPASRAAAIMPGRKTTVKHWYGFDRLDGPERRCETLGCHRHQRDGSFSTGRHCHVCRSGPRFTQPTYRHDLPVASEERGNDDLLARVAVCALSKRAGLRP